MDENRPPYSLQTPGAASPASTLHLPSRDAFPRVDDHLVEPETSRDEMIGGELYQALPADAPHGIQNSELDYVLRAHAAAGYRVANDLLTRFDEDSDFASDTAVLRDGVDPETGTRYLEEMAFEVVSKQNEAKVREKVPRMLRRGVRRIFAVFVKQQEVREWSQESDTWIPLDPETPIEDPCLGQPLLVKALLDAVEADDAVVRALLSKDNREIRKIEADSKAQGKAEGVLTVLEARGLAVTEHVRRRILTCTNPATLDRWLRRAVSADSAVEVVEDH